MFSETEYRKGSARFLALLTVIAMLFAFSACADGNHPAPDQGDDGLDNRYCSFEISNLNDTFDLNQSGERSSCSFVCMRGMMKISPMRQRDMPIKSIMQSQKTGSRLWQTVIL